MQRPLVRVIQVAVTVGCLALLWQIADGELALRHLADANPRWMAAALAALTLQTALSALRWRLTARQLGIRLEWRTAMREYYLAQLLNQVLPGGVLGDAGRALRARGQAGLLASGQAVLFERLAGQIGLFMVFGAGAAATLAVPNGLMWPDWLRLPVALLLLVGVGSALVLWRAGTRMQGVALPAKRGFGAAFVHAIAGPEVRSLQLVMSLGTALCNIAAFAFCAAAIGVSLSLQATQVLVPLILFTMLIPLSVSGWGVREGAAASLLPLAGATSAEGLAASVAFGVALFFAALPGLGGFVLASTPKAVKS